MIQNTNGLMLFLSLAGLLSLVVSFILVFINKGNTIASKLLGGCLFLLSLLSLDSILMKTPSYFQSAVSYAIFATIFFSLPPLVYSYVRTELNQKGRFSGHFANKVNYQWLRLFSLALGACWLLSIIRFMQPHQWDVNIGQFSGFAVSGIMLFLCLYLLFHPYVLYGNALHEEPVIEMAPEMQHEEPVLILEKNLSPKASLSIEQTLKYKQLIKDHFAESLAFRKPGYAIRDLSNETGIPGYLLSFFINQEYGMNFNEMINAYRVEYLIGLLKTSFDWQSYTLEAIGKMAGFNSRTAFIAAIKKYTGMTPSTLFGRRDSEKFEHLVFSFPELARKVA
jgi:AraC-like DNA-binding protein